LSSSGRVQWPNPQIVLSSADSIFLEGVRTLYCQVRTSAPGPQIVLSSADSWPGPGAHNLRTGGAPTSADRGCAHRTICGHARCPQMVLGSSGVRAQNPQIGVGASVLPAPNPQIDGGGLVCARRVRTSIFFITTFDFPEPPPQPRPPGMPPGSQEVRAISEPRVARMSQAKRARPPQVRAYQAGRARKALLGVSRAVQEPSWDR